MGRIPVYLLDTNCPENAPSDRDITHRLYGGDESTRIRQEMILGIGGIRALRALGIKPAVFHLNEGHAAFLILELLREHLGTPLQFNAALEAVASACVFTTHTPVAAGHDAFNHDLVLSHFSDFIKELGLPVERFLELARSPSAPGMFNMTRLALNGTRHVNAVSRIHGIVSARLCADQWPEIRPEDNPMGFVTNGVHVPTFLHQTWNDFFDRELSRDWRERLRDAGFWAALEHVPDERYWPVAQSVKSRMLASVRDRLQREYARKGMSPAQLRHVTRLLDPLRPNVLTIGFARRFATYKRATLLLRDRARLAKLVNNPARPVLFLFAGKAHPADVPGQQVLREIRQLMTTPEFMGRIIFLEDYDLQLARWLVSGVDVWLNNPIAPLEASGTSGIKASINGRLNLSVLDGWWAEAWVQDNGWGIPPANVQDPERRDALEAELIFDTLEEEVLPLYYDNNEEGYSPEWVRRSKRAMMTVIPAVQHAPRAVRLHPGPLPARRSPVPTPRGRRIRRGGRARRVETACPAIVDARGSANARRRGARSPARRAATPAYRRAIERPPALGRSRGVCHAPTAARSGPVAAPVVVFQPATARGNLERRIGAHR